MLEVIILKKNKLGNTGLEVSEFCLGVLPMGPLQANLSEEKCIELIKKALDKKVNFLDTAEMYSTQKYIGKAVKGRREEVIIATKSNAKTYEKMAESVKISLEELGTDYIDIYHLHAARATEDIFEERKGALEFLKEMKEKGLIKAIGISTHGIKAVDKAAEIGDIDVVYPLINKKGLGLLHGVVEQMIQAIRKCHKANKGIYAMKVLGGGNLIHDLRDSLNFVRNINEIDSISVGVISVDELYLNLQLFGANDIEIKELPDTTSQKKIYISKNLCKGCGKCIENCPNQALFLKDEIAEVDHDKCIICGYCSPECTYFAIRLI